MKTYTRGIVAAAFLVVVAGGGLGIAQAGGISSDSPALTVQDQEAVMGDSIAETPEGQEIPQVSTSQKEMVPEGNWSGNDWQAMGPVETGSLSDRGDENDLDHTNVPVEGNVSQYWGSDNPSN
jgi:hypothetical protein